MCLACSRGQTWGKGRDTQVIRTEPAPGNLTPPPHCHDDDDERPPMGWARPRLCLKDEGMRLWGCLHSIYFSQKRVHCELNAYQSEVFTRPASGEVGSSYLSSGLSGQPLAKSESFPASSVGTVLQQPLRSCEARPWGSQPMRCGLVLEGQWDEERKR